MTTRRPRGQVQADINVTPLVDVVLVLLIIFMVTAPFLQGGLEIDLPKVATRGIDVREGLVVSVRADRSVAVGNTIVPFAGFEGDGATNVKPDFAVVASQQPDNGGEEVRASWLIHPEAALRAASGPGGRVSAGAGEPARAGVFMLDFPHSAEREAVA